MVNEKPVILVTIGSNLKHGNLRRNDVSVRTADSVARAGGLPVYETERGSAEDLAELCDALLLSGGWDVDPGRYGEKAIPGLVTADPDRDAFEILLTKAFLAAGKPILGICRGCQVLNVALGGDLWQDLPTQTGVWHSSPTPVEGFEDPVLFHEVTAVPGSPIARLFGERFLANSIHHQACRTLGKGLIPDGVSAEDGIIESFRHETRPWYGVQFHPAMMAGVPEDGPAGDFLPLFMAFVNEVRKDAAKRAASMR